MMIGRWKHSSFKQQLWGVLQGIAEIIDGLVVVLSLGFYASWLSNQVVYARALDEILERKKNEQDSV